MTRPLGRGNNTITMLPTTVIKQTSDFEQARFMLKYPEVFADVHAYREEGDYAVITMPRYAQVTDPLVLLNGLEVLHILWAQSNLGHSRVWRRKLEEHLEKRIRQCKLAVEWNFVERVIHDLPEPLRPCIIHGDATLSNLLYDVRNRRWRWIDPLQKAYIPGDRAVDLGKMLQSCWGYEDVLLYDTIPTFNELLAKQLCHAARVSYEDAQRWCIIHLIRLLPYQDTRVRTAFEEVLQALSSSTWTALSSIPERP